MNGFELVSRMVEGSAAEVFLAREPGKASPVLLEVSRPDVTRDMELYGRFLDKAKERQGLVHPNLVVRERIETMSDGRIVSITGPMSGHRLSDRLIANGPMPAAWVIPIALQLCDALGYLHGRGVVHGSLRPSYVFLDGPDDAPMARLLDTGLTLFRSTKSVSTPMKLVLVPGEYLSPERIHGQRASNASDIYGLGVLIHELLAGRPPFTNPDPFETRRLHVEAPVPPLPWTAVHLTGVLQKALAKDPAQRFGSVAQLRAALQLAQAEQPRETTVRLPGPPPPLPRSEVPPIVQGVALGDTPSVQVSPSADVLGSYQLLELLGEGGMGRVYRAVHQKLGRQVAIKVLRPELSRDPDQLHRFFQEARAVNQINHPNIVEVHDFVEEPREQGGRVYCVMELIAGASLREVGREAPLKVTRAAKVVREVALALEAAHRAGVVHRDVKPHNVMLSARPDGTDAVKVLDFGVAKLRGGGKPGLRTQPGIVVGTPAYMAPEQAVGDVVDARADIYSLGTVLYVLLAGKFPFESSSSGSLITELLTKPPRPLPAQSSSGEFLPPALREVAMRALAKRPNDRFQTMQELADALVPFTVPPQVVTALSSPDLEDDAPPRRRWPWVLVLLGLSAAAFVLRPWARPTQPAVVKPAPPQQPRSPPVEPGQAVPVLTPPRGAG